MSSDSAAIMKQLNKDFGAGVVNKASKSWVDLPRLPTGVFPLDLAMGGGFPMGKCSEVYGGESSGKTNLMYKTIAQGQILYPDKNAVFIDAEHGFDPVWAQSLGVNTDRLIIVHPEYAEQAADIIESFLYATDVFVIVLDSIAALTTQNEADSSTEKAAVGGASNLIGKMYRKITVAYQKLGNSGALPPAFIGVNQIRIKIGQMFGNPETRPGGNAPRFAASMVVRCYGKNEVVKAISAAMPAYKDTNCTLMKWKVPILAINSTFKMAMLPIGNNPPGYVDSWNTLCAYMKELDYLSKEPKGGWLMIGEQFKTLEEAKAWLYADPDKLQQVQGIIISEMLAKGSTPSAEEMKEPEDVGVA